jgi:hypothetical protein
VRKTQLSLAVLALAASASTSALAQSVPTTQPTFLNIFREEVKAARTAEHAQWETGWPAAFEKVKSPNNYLALSSISGSQEVWYVGSFASQAAFGQSTDWEDAQPGLTAEVDRLAKGDAEFLSGATALQAVAVPELSYGAFPDIGKMRYWEISTWRIRLGHDEEWAAATKTYKAATARSAPNSSWRTYRVVAGAPDGTFLTFSSVASFGDFDKMMAAGEAVGKGFTAEEGAALGKFMKESVVSISTNRYRLDPKQSYVDAATKAKDPAFWSPKKP